MVLDAKFRRSATLAAALLAALGLAGVRLVRAAEPVAPKAADTIAAPKAADTIAATKPARLDYKITTLDNGLKLITLEDRNAPVVTVQLWYRAGSKDEAVGKAGFAHMFEHIMFKGSKNVALNEYTKLIEQIGGEYNANTSFDRTMFYETIPSNALDRVLFLEADRMAGLTVDDANVKSERDVVKEEHRLRVENAPYGALLENIQKQSYPEGHPYRHTTIGIMEDLDRAGTADIKAFHDEYYKPDNATMVLVGDFKTADAVARVKKYFGAIPKSATGKFTRYSVPAGEQTKETRATYYDKLAPLPLVGMAYALPTPASPDYPAFGVISQILSAGQSSRLYRSLVRDKQVAVAAQGQSLDLLLGGAYFFFGVANVGKGPADVENALQAEVDKLRNQPVSQGELTKAKNQVLTALVFGRLSTQQRADALGEADLLYGTPEEANSDYEKIAAITAADIQRVAQKYFAPTRRNVFYVLPQKGDAPKPATVGAATSTPSAATESK